MKNSLFVFLFLLLPILVCSEELQIPVMVGQTGASAHFGKGELEAYQLAVEEWNSRGGVNGKKISLLVEDTNTNQKQILTAFQRLTLAESPVILGPTWLDAYQAIIPVAQRKNVLLVTPSAAKEAFSSENLGWPVTFYHNSTLETEQLVAGLKKLGHQNIGILYEQEPFSEMIRRLILEHLPAPVFDKGVQGGEGDFRAIFAKLKEDKPDAIIVLVWNEKSLLSLLQQVRLFMPKVQLATLHDGEGWLTNPIFQPYLKNLLYTKFVIQDRTFVPRFRKRFGSVPILTTSNAYDAINAVLTAMQAGRKTAQEIRDYITSQPIHSVTFGTFTFPQDGHVPSKVVIENKKIAE